MAVRGGWRRRAAMVGLLGVSIAGIPAGPVLGGTPAVEFTRIFHGFTCFEAHNNVAGADITLELRSSSDVLKGTLSYTDRSVGSLEDCFTGTILGGDHIDITVDGAERRLDVPRMRIKSVDRAADRVTVTGDPGLPLTLTVLRCPLTGGFNPSNCPMRYGRAITLDANGKRVPDVTSAIDLRGFDLVMLTHTGPSGDRFEVRRAVPVFFATLGSSSLTAILLPGTSGTYRLRTAGGTLRGSLTMPGDVSGTDRVFRKNNVAVKVKAGNTITGTVPGDAGMTVPAGIQVVDVATDVVAGRCFAGRRFLIEGALEAFTGTASPSGAFSIDLTSRGGFSEGAIIRLTCQSKRGDALEHEVDAS